MKNMKNIYEAAKDYVESNHSPSEAGDFQAAMNVAVAKGYVAGASYVLDEFDGILLRLRRGHTLGVIGDIDETIQKLRGALTENCE